MFPKGSIALCLGVVFASATGTAQTAATASETRVVENVQQAVERIVAIGQQGQLCSAELARLQVERARIDKEGTQLAITLPKMIEDHTQLQNRNGAPKAQLAKALDELQRIDRRVRADVTKDGFKRDLQEIDAKIRKHEECVAEASKRLGRYHSPAAAPAKPQK